MAGREGGIKFYTHRAARTLIFWTFSATCMQTFQALNMPDILRDDVLNPEQANVRQFWCATPSDAS